VIAWIWFAICQVFAFVVLMPLGWLIVGLAVLCGAHTDMPVTASIKPMPGREYIDRWTWPINAIYGNPEDGVTGMDALGPSWTGFYNPTGSRWLAFKWSGLRNWADGFNYITWIFSGTPPLLVKDYTFFGSQRQLKLGWQQRYGRTVMVCSP
jgi:hypothetical protein